MTVLFSPKNRDVAFEMGRELCNDLHTSGEREWIVTNGIGGFAAGTVAGLLTRRYHGLLIAALKPPGQRMLLATKFDETVEYGAADYPLFTNCWVSGVVDPNGYEYLERFHLEGTTPVWTYAFRDAVLQKRVWMQPGANTTYVHYQFLRGLEPLTLNVKALVNYRGYHNATKVSCWRMDLKTVSNGIEVVANPDATPFYLLSDRATATPRHVWYRGYHLGIEAYRGLEAQEDHLYAADFTATLSPGEAVTFVISTEDDPTLDGDAAYAERQAYEQALLEQASRSTVASSPSMQRLILAADQFIVKRPTSVDPDGRTVIAGYPWFNDWGRDTMIALPGLTLNTGRFDLARQILCTYAQYVDQGMLPNRFPDEGETPEYNTVDASLWYFEAMRAYHEATQDNALLASLFPILQDMIDWHRRGTRYGIYEDPRDGLLHAGEPGVQLTWMDAKVGDWVVTPRIGKPVEVNALWYNALSIMAEFAVRLGKPSTTYAELAAKVRQGFDRFWNEAGGYCYDVIDGPEGYDASLRPNQLLAVSLPHSPLSEERQRAVVDTCTRQLVTSHGLRSLAPDDPRFIGHYAGDQRQRDGAYHQGTVWAWLIGPFVSAHLRVYQNPDMARSFLQPLLNHLPARGMGNISEIFDGDPPFTPRGCFAQAWSVAELLRAWSETEARP